MKNITETLISLLDNKPGTLEKLEIHTESQVSVGSTKGLILVQTHEDYVWLNCISEYNFLKTSPIQSIVFIDENEKGLNVTFKTVTSTYKATIEKEEENGTK